MKIKKLPKENSELAKEKKINEKKKFEKKNNFGLASKSLNKQKKSAH